MEKARDFILEIFNYLKKPEMRILPGQLAFFLVISIIPMLALIVTIAAALSISIDNVRIAINESIPSGLANILNDIIQGNGSWIRFACFGVCGRNQTSGNQEYRVHKSRDGFDVCTWQGPQPEVSS